MPASWWGDYRFANGEAKRLQIGPLSLVILRSKQEWRIGHEQADSEGESKDWQIATLKEFPEQAPNPQRFAFTQTSEHLSVLPALADRPVVSSPRIPLLLAPGETVRLFVSSPLWIRIAVNDPSQFLCEIPIHRPSDTWFGASPLDGELCYATRTRAVLEMENVSYLHRRAITPMQIQNHTGTTFALERLKLPVPFLSLFSSDENLLWTEELKIVRREDSEMALVEIEKGSPSAAKGGRLISAPREASLPNLLLRVFSSIFRLDI